MKPHSAIALICSLALASPGVADTFLLKDGSKLEGKILREDAESYTLVVQVTSSIKDEKIVPKSDVVKVEREQPDEKAFLPISKILPMPDLLSASDYASSIAEVNRFLKAYPDSSHVRKAKEILATLKKESDTISSGGVKVGGVMVTPADYQANELEFDANVREAKIRALVAERQFLGALREYEVFTKDFDNTAAAGSIAPLMTQVVQTYMNEAKQALATLEDREQKRMAGLERMSTDDRAVSQKAIEDETASMQARFEAEKAANVHWFTTSPYNKASLEEAVRNGETELKRLAERKPLELGKDAGRAYHEAWAMIHNGSSDAAVTTAISDAKSAGVPTPYVEKLEAAKGKP